MAHKVTLGGDRLGSGNKQKVELHGFERSTHDLSYLWRSSMAAGTLVPFMKLLVLPGDTIDIGLATDIMTHPTIGPLLGSYKVQLDVFECPIRLYNALLHNNALNIGRDMSQVKFPQITLKAHPIGTDPADADNAQINPSSVLAYLGIRGVGNTEVDNVTRKFNAIPLLALWDIYKQYYANKQEEVGAVIHTPSVALVETVDTVQMGSITEFPTGDGQVILKPGDILTIQFTGALPIPTQIMVKTKEFGWINWGNLGTWAQSSMSEMSAPYTNTTYGTITGLQWRYVNSTDITDNAPQVSFFNLTNIDDMRKAILANQSTVAPFDVNAENYAPYSWILGDAAGRANALNTQEGLPVKTYQSDLFNNWLNTEWLDGSTGVNAITAISTESGSFTIDTLNLSTKVYKMLNRIAVSGGTYNDWLNAQYDHDRIQGAETPIYHGSLIRELVFQELTSTAESSSGAPQGTLAGKGTLNGKKKGGDMVVKVNEPGYLIGLISLTPRVDYSQGNDWDMYALETMADLHVPMLDEIGFQDLIAEQQAYWSTKWNGTTWVQQAAGKQPAWINYMTSVNKVLGNFAIPTNEMFMTLNRRYEYSDAGITDLTSYIDPAKFNFIFAQTSIDSQNFWAQVACNITARRKMSAKVMPNL